MEQQLQAISNEAPEFKHGKPLTGIALELAKIIDDISTASDIYHPEIKGFEEYVYRRIREANNYFTSDGYTLFEQPVEEDV